jgi:antitoxin HigA-1
MATDLGERIDRPGFRPAHPGRILRRNLEALDMAQGAFAEHIGISRQHLNAIINGHDAVTAGLAARLGKAFSVSAQFWLNLQAAHDVWDAEKRPAVKRIEALQKTGGMNVATKVSEILKPAKATIRRKRRA